MANGGIACKAIEISFAGDVPNPYAFPAAKHYAKRFVVVRAKSIFRLN